MTDEQGKALADLMRRFNAPSANVSTGTGGLPKDWVYVVLRPSRGNEFHCGINPTGEVSS